MSSWTSTTLEVPGASSTFSYRGSSPSNSPSYQPLPTFEDDSDSNAGSSIDVSDEKCSLSYDSDEAAVKLYDRDLSNTRRTRLKIGIALAATAITALYLLLPFYRSTSGASLTLLLCGNATCAERGWVLQSQEESAGALHKAGLQMLDSQKQTSLACADLWISRGEICETIRQGHVKLNEPSISAIWSYSDPSSPHYKAWLAESSTAEHTAPLDLAEPAPNDGGQLRYSMRSAMQNLPFLQQAIVRIPSLPISKPGEPPSSCSVAQVPPWLDIGKATSVDSKLKLLPYRPFNQNASAAIGAHTAITKTGGLLSGAAQQASEVDYHLFLDSNQYIRKELSAADFASPLYGAVFRLSSNEQEPEGSVAIQKLLALRFGTRYRPALQTTAAAVSSAMLHETESIWPERTAMPAFTSNALLSTLYTVGKHREALLWSFLVAKSDADGSRTYSRQERQAILAALKGYLIGSVLEVKTKKISTKNEALEYQDKLEETGLTPSLATKYIHAGLPITHGRARHHKQSDTTTCGISIGQCFGSADFFTAAGSVPVEDTFKRIAFQHPDCGNCMIAALTGASPHTGLEAFLPSRAIRRPRTLRSRKAAEETVPHIGGTARDWRDADFSLKTAIGSEWKPRDFAVRLIQRYSYVIGETSHLNWTFGRTGQQDERAFGVSMRKSDPALLTLATASAGDALSANAEEAHRALGQYQEAAWPMRMAYEL